MSLILCCDFPPLLILSANSSETVLIRKLRKERAHETLRSDILFVLAAGLYLCVIGTGGRPEEALDDVLGE